MDRAVHAHPRNDVANPDLMLPVRRRLGPLVGAVAVVAIGLWLILSLALKEPAWTVLPSGERIRIIAVGPVFLANGDKLLRLRYATRVPLQETRRVRAEAMEVWPVLRSLAERQGYVLAALTAQAAGTGLCVRDMGLCAYVSYGLVLRRDQDGDWSIDGEKERLPR